MRNLKRALSLTLASVMLLGMMVVGSSAAAGYDDVAETDNVEAIEVLQAIEVMVGDERGFGPERPVNRAEMAVVMGKLLSLDYNYYSTSCPFSDVYDWAQGWVGACAANGIVSGRSDGIYDPGATVTAVEAASMLMRALGYFQYSNDYADGFEVSTVRQGKIIGIFDGVGSSATEPMTRNQVAQMVLNALQSSVVEPDGNTTTFLNPDGTVLATTGKVNYVSVTSSKTFATAIKSITATSIGSSNTGYMVELGERLYDGKLKLRDNAQDAFGRPARKWEYDGKEIGTYAKVELLKAEYTTKVTGKDLYELIGKGTIDDNAYDFYIAIDGETEKEVLNSQTNVQKDQYFFDRGSLLRTNTNQVGGTGNGVLTQVYIDTENKDVYIVVINTYLAEAEADYNEKKDEAVFTLYKLDEYKSTGKLVKDGPADSTRDMTSMKVSGEDFDVVDVKDGDKFLACVAEGEIQILSPVETIEDAIITSFRLDSYLVTDGTQYDYASTARYDANTLNAYDNNNMKDTKYRVFLDNYGYVIGVEIVDDPDQYVFLTGIDSVTQNRSDVIGEGTIIFLDGTVNSGAKIDLKKSKSVNDAGDDREAMSSHVNSLMNTWCTYSVSENGVYTLTEVGTTNATMNKSGQSHLTDAKLATAGSGDWNVKYNALADGTNQDGKTINASATTGGVLKTIDKKNISLPGVSDSIFKTVYGNDHSIYMSAELDQITAKNVLNTADPDDEPAVIITGVDAITTGVQGANLVAWNARRVLDESDAAWQTQNPCMADVSNGVYTLFDNKGYVVAAIVVGEDDSSSTQYAWVSGIKMDYESHNSSKWTYSREVIIDGKVTYLTEIETDGQTEADIKANNYWTPSNTNNAGSYVWEVKMKADGTVKNVIVPTFTASYSKYINDMSYREGNTNGTIVLNQSFAEDGWLVRDIGRTLHVETDNAYGVAEYTEGFPVASNANIIVVKDEEIYRDNKTISEYNYKAEKSESFVCGDDGKGLQRAVRSLNDNKNFKGWIVAIFDGGVATSVILYDQTRTEVDINNKPGVSSVTGTYIGYTDTVLLTFEGDELPAKVDQQSATLEALKASRDDIASIEMQTFVGATVDKAGSYSAKAVRYDGSTLVISGKVILTQAGLLDVSDTSKKPTLNPDGSAKVIRPLAKIRKCDKIGV